MLFFLQLLNGIVGWCVLAGGNAGRPPHDRAKVAAALHLTLACPSNLAPALLS